MPDKLSLLSKKKVNWNVIFQGGKVKIFTFAYGQAGNSAPPPSYGQSDHKIPGFFLRLPFIKVIPNTLAISDGFVLKSQKFVR